MINNLLTTGKNSTEICSESGRSMVEMLGVLAVVGVLSIGGIMGYSYAMDKSRANRACNDIRLRAVTLQTQNAMGRNLDLSEYNGMNTVYDIRVATATELPAGYGMVVSNVPQRVCEMIYQNTSNWATVQINGTNADSADSCRDTNNMTFAFNPDGEVNGGDENNDGGGNNEDNITTEGTNAPSNCKEGFYKDSNGNCQCAGFVINGECQEEFTFWPEDGICPDGSASNEGTQGQCFNCLGGIVSADGLSCKTCGSGYYNDGRACNSCNGGTSDGLVCTSCASGYYKNSSGGCSPCPSNNTETCTQDGFVCKNGYYKADYYCGSCNGGTSDGIVCTSCANGYYKSGNQCYSCDGGTSDGIVCTSCKDGYYLNNGYCSSCPRNSTCTSYSNFTCKDGYVNRGTYCDRNCQSNATNIDGLCVCGDGYVNRESTCSTSCQSNAVAVNGICVCKDGYYKSGSSCYSCPSNSKTCTQDGFTCNDGYYKDWSTCYSCNGGTSDGIKCTSCTENYYVTNGRCQYCSGEIVNGECIYETTTQAETATQAETTVIH